MLLLKTILTKDPLGIVVLTGAKVENNSQMSALNLNELNYIQLKHSSAVGLQNIASVLGTDLARRFISLRNLSVRFFSRMYINFLTST